MNKTNIINILPFIHKDIMKEAKNSLIKHLVNRFTMIYIKRILFIIVVIPIVLSSCIPFVIATFITPLYVCAYYVKYGSLQDIAILLVCVTDFYERFINKINPN